MTQSDFDIANQGFPAFRADMNTALLAAVSLTSGLTEPSTKFAYQWWADTTTGFLKIRNAANNAWIVVGTLASINLGLQQAAKGADIASASPLVLGTDGSYFDVTGTTGFSTMVRCVILSMFIMAAITGLRLMSLTQCCVLRSG